jgi:hypothetical protein
MIRAALFSPSHDRSRELWDDFLVINVIHELPRRRVRCKSVANIFVFFHQNHRLRAAHKLTKQTLQQGK